MTTQALTLKTSVWTLVEQSIEVPVPFSEEPTSTLHSCVILGKGRVASYGQDGISHLLGGREAQNLS